MKKSSFITLILCLLAGSAVRAQTRMTREEYIDRYKSIAVAHMERYGIPASITLAQGILESDCGNSQLSRRSNNHFGIKCKKNWNGERVYHDDDDKGECFRAYSSVEASYQDHAEFLDTQPRYDSLFRYSPTDYRSWARGLKACGYATAPDYPQRLTRIIEESELYLLDRENGESLYASRHRNASEQAADAFAAGSSVTDPRPTDAERIDPDDFRVTINAFRGYNIYLMNGVHYILAKEGDTFETLGGLFRISARNLRKFNDLDRRAQPVQGEMICIGRKKRRWEGNAMNHIVQPGETIASVAQSYAIRTRSLAKLNKLDAATPLTPGMTLRIR